MSERLETWIHDQEAPDLCAIEAPMEPELAEQIYELERCITVIGDSSGSEP